LQGGGVILSAPVVADRKMLGGQGASARFSTIYGNNVLVGERKVVKEKGRVSSGIGIATRMNSVLGRRLSVKMSPLPPVPKIPAALGQGGTPMGGNGPLPGYVRGTARGSLISFHSTVNGPLPEYFDPAVGGDAATVAVLQTDNTNLLPERDSFQEVTSTTEGGGDRWEARRPKGAGMRRTHSVRSRSASRPGKIRARMPSPISRASSRGSTRSNKSNTPRSIQRTMSGASRKSNLSRETGHGPHTGGTIRTSPYIGGTTPKSAGAPFKAPLTPASIAPPPQTPLPAVPTLKKKARKAKPARIMLPQEILAMEARRESRRDEMRMLAEKQETVMRPIQEAEASCRSGGDNDDGFRTETDSENEILQLKPEKVVGLMRGSSTIPRVVMASSPASAAPLLARKATPRPTRKPVPSTIKGHVYSIFPTSPRRGSQGQLVFPPPTLPGAVRRQDSGLKSPGMAHNLMPTPPPRALSAKPEVAAGSMKSMRRRNTMRKSTIVSPTPKVGFTGSGVESVPIGASSFDFDFLPLGIALTPLRVPVVVTLGGEIMAEISGERSDLITERFEEKQGHGEVVAMGDSKESAEIAEVKEEKVLTSILNRPRPKKPQARPVARGRSTARNGNRESQVYGLGAGVSVTFYKDSETEEASSGAETPDSPEFQGRKSEYDSKIFTMLPTTSSPAGPSTPSAAEVELDDSAHFDVTSIARSSLPGSLRESFYEELRLKYSNVSSGLSSDLDSEEEGFVGGVRHMGTPPLDSDKESDAGSSFGGSPPLPPPGSPLKPLRIQKAPTMLVEMDGTSMSVEVAKKEEAERALRRASGVEVAELDQGMQSMVAELEAQIKTAVVIETPVAMAPVQRQQTLRKPVPIPTRTASTVATNVNTSKALPPIPLQTPQNTDLPSSVPRSTSRATINPAFDNSSSSSSYGPDPNEAFAALQMRTGDPFYSPTSQKVVPRYISAPPIPPRPAPQAPTQRHQHRQPNMLPGMPKRRVELPRFARTIRQTPAPSPSVPVKETSFFLDVRTPGSKTVYSSSPPLRQEDIPTPLAGVKPVTTIKQLTQTPLGTSPVTVPSYNSRQTAGTRPRATTHSGVPPPIPMHAYPPPPVPPIPRNIPNAIPTTSGPLPPPPPHNYESVMFLNRNSDPISAMNGNEHVLSHYTPGTLITVPNAPPAQVLHRVDPPKSGGHWRSKSSGEDTASHTTSGGAVRHTMKVRLEKAFKIGTDRHGVVELGQGGFGGNWAEAQEDGVAVKKEVRKHASKPSLGGWGTRLKSGVFGGSGQGH